MDKFLVCRELEMLLMKYETKIAVLTLNSPNVIWNRFRIVSGKVEKLATSSPVGVTSLNRKKKPVGKEKWFYPLYSSIINLTKMISWSWLLNLFLKQMLTFAMVYNTSGKKSEQMQLKNWKLNNRENSSLRLSIFNIPWGSFAMVWQIWLPSISWKGH